MTTIDFRREWVKRKVTKYFGLPNDSWFEYMMANTDDLEDNLASYLDDDFFADGGSRRQIFYVFKTKRDKIIEEEVVEEVTGKFLQFTGKYWTRNTGC
ncbi:unnamed protein product [Acanthoscelides obtectus]|uniref:Uncharacterized protein n=1 Tax=Acanthoscelides obtectus TaxID=200917 RepID=A0A9P0MD86_ACAOB|nr:unnamed protein product [Acanthoscelides obtectus]CAK1670840.1 hypothetical protein AOBTE_LOCUS27866 [Acanthoscelides obtectus]